MSDHLAIPFHLNVKDSRSFKPPHKIFDYKRADFDGLRKSMSDSAETFFASAPQNFAVEDNWPLFKTTLTKGMVNYIPQRYSYMKYKLPWITLEIKRQMSKKDRLHKKALCYQKPDHWVAFKKQRNLVSRIVKEPRSDYLNNVVGASLQENPEKFGLMSDLVNQRTLAYPLCDMVITCALLIKPKPRHLIPICTQYLLKRNYQSLLNLPPRTT